MNKIIKLAFAVFLMVYISIFLSNSFGVPLFITIGLGIIGFLVKVPQGSLMAGINVTQVAAEFGAYARSNNKEVRSFPYNAPQAAQYMKTITKVKGKWPAGHAITGRLVQGFKAIWNPIGETKFKANDLVNYHQKVNFSFVPAEVIPSWYADLYTEGLKPEQMPISQYVFNTQLKPAVVRDIDHLIGNGVYDSNDLSAFGKSMNGLKKIFADGLVSTERPMYRIPLAPLTANNMVDSVEHFEDSIPEEVRDFMGKIYMSSKNKERYRKDYRNIFGGNTDYSKDATTMTYSGGREIVGLKCLNGSDIMFTTPDANFLKLIDVIDSPPEITDVQVQDYEVKVFMEFWLGVAFWINEMVIISAPAASGSGLLVGNEIYYPDQNAN